MADIASDRFEITYTLNAADYAQYFRAMGRRGRSWTALNVLLLVAFTAIPAALLFRALAMHWTADTDTIEMVGRTSLFAYVLGFLATMTGGWVLERIRTRKFVGRMQTQSDSRMTALDRGGITVTGKLSRATWQWGAISGLTREGDLLLLWIASSTALLIPSRSFASAEACETAQVFIRERIAEAGAARGGIAPATW